MGKWIITFIIVAAILAIYSGKFISRDFSFLGEVFLLGMISLIVTITLRRAYNGFLYYKQHPRAKREE